ncbi:MAG: PSD1 and planctomycete cytochrome C domain-containing protein [Pirellulales bacterium]|nr:PSD1 and planctomycete cytochrome C domain-containing protein [Pirellulales bacterium]
MAPLVGAWIGLLASTAHSTRAAEQAVDFNRDILPLLSENCFQCHGPDEARREAGLRLDRREDAFAELESGARAILPGDRQRSVVFQRITASDPELVMPPPESGKTLSPEVMRRVGEWIDGGAPWAGHWAFEAPERKAPPARVDGWRVENPIDVFIHARLQPAALVPAAQATKESLIRRATLDLTGLPPTLAEVDRFLGDDAAGAYERVVDRLLSSSRYGEHMARSWLDAARYGDTHGLHLDNERSIWPYRDWVITAFNRNLPFDQFTMEQLAGDLLPSATLQQRVATGFNRCNVTTGEGGTIDEEYYVRYAVDRVETTATVWMGLTAGCAACHDHKFDPLTQKDFYQLFSYFFSLTEKALDGNVDLPPPSVKVPSREQTEQKQRLQAEIASLNLKQKIKSILNDTDYVDPAVGASLPPVSEEEVVWFDDELPEGAQAEGDGEQSWRRASAPDHPVLSGQTSFVRAAKGLRQDWFASATKRLKAGTHDRLFVHVYIDKQFPTEMIQLRFHDESGEYRAFWGYDKDIADGNNATNVRIGDLPEAGKWVRLEVPAAAVGLEAGAEIDGWSFAQFNGTVYWDKVGVVAVAPLTLQQQESRWLWEQFRRQVKSPALPDTVRKALRTHVDKRTEDQEQQLAEYFLTYVYPSTRELLSDAIERSDALQAELADLEKAIPGTLVMEERDEPRQAHILERGEYTLKREMVSSRVPEWILPAAPDMPANRLGLAQWLVDDSHPLTARVAVNRFWQQVFGIGLVKTVGDFGLQGERPSHPQLLDWLAVDFVESGWDVKRLQKLMVMSATYRQSSHVSDAKLAVDPENRLLARGPRFRLDAEVIRDQALAVSGLLVGTIGGKSCKPYQPAGLWKPVGFTSSNTREFKQDHGDNLYRRSMYTFWKRTSPPPSMCLFDAPDRETCQVRRARTNTPLQALVLLNDVQFLEAARKFAERVVTEGGSDVEHRISFAYRSVTARRPSEGEIATLSRLLAEYRREFDRNPEAAIKLLSAGESPRNEAIDVGELGAWTMITHLILNLHETITKG